MPEKIIGAYTSLFAPETHIFLYSSFPFRLLLSENECGQV